MSNFMTKKKFTHNALMCGFNAFGIDDTIEQGMQTLTKSLSLSFNMVTNGKTINISQGD